MAAHRSTSVTVHFAQTLDGRIAARDGSSRWISSEESLRFAHRLRAEHDAVMVGAGTIVADDPRLTVRLVPGRSPLRIVVDSTLRIPPTARVVTDDTAPTLVATTERATGARRAALEALGVEVVTVVSGARGEVDLAALLAYLGERGVRTVLLEGGRALITSALRERLVDRVVVCIAPKILGTGIEAVGDIASARLDDALRLEALQVTRLGPDLIVDAVLDGVALSV
jgi:5-amino-6-(5-phosphoribosylamino)uracil reductase/diaminohydroxyphosphoribosylaminopyrimidine deaminase/5-amino-6-(5-phosphoribosylamino)uracil reductase